VNVETKEQSEQQLMHTHSPYKLKEFKQMSARKLKATVFWDRKEVLMVEFMQQGTTITSQVYYETLKKLCTASQKNWHGILTSGTVLLHDNAHLHTAACTLAVFEVFQLGVV
jgi:hypothetical protein